jgi:hypothetical protein
MEKAAARFLSGRLSVSALQDCLFSKDTGFAGKRFFNPIYLLLLYRY